MEEDIFGILDETDESKRPSENKPRTHTSANNNGQVNLWDAEIKAVEPAKDGLKRFNRTVVITSGDKVPESVQLMVDKIVGALLNKGFTVRWNGGDRDILGKTAYDAAGGSTDIYLPWKSFNKDIKNPRMTKPLECGYQHGAFYHGAYAKIPPQVRAIVSSQMHMILGERCDTPINLLITYTDDGAEVTKEADYKKTGFMYFFIKACEDLDVPVFNLKNESAIENIKNFIDTLK